MTYALIGCGRIAENHINAALSNNLEIVAVCDVSKENIEKLLKKHPVNYEIKKYNDYKEMILETSPDLVSIATPSGIHAEIALFCIKHKINVIIEKPIAMSIEDANKIIKYSKENQVKVSVCHQNRFNIAVQRMRNAVNDGRFGKISHGSVNIRWNRNKNYYMQSSWRGKWHDDGGALMNQCIHGIDLLLWMMDSEAEFVYGVTRQRFHDYIEAEDVGIAIIKFKNGTIASIEGTTNVFSQNLEETLYLFGENGTVKLGGKSANNIDIWEFNDDYEVDAQNRGLKEATANVYGNGHIILFNDMINAIKENRHPYVDALAGKKALEIVLAIYKSQKTGLPVQLPLQNFSSQDMKGEFE